MSVAERHFWQGNRCALKIGGVISGGVSQPREGFTVACNFANGVRLRKPVDSEAVLSTELGIMIVFAVTLMTLGIFALYSRSRAGKVVE